MLAEITITVIEIWNEQNRGFSRGSALGNEHALKMGERLTRRQSQISAWHLMPALERRRDALLQRRGGYRSVAALAFKDIDAIRRMNSIKTAG
ncbi:MULTISPECIES: hypothetical protein [unclassified Bradyrhizobium]|uniref:hypothetical protein n=1 Tax=unclassified Bradyrhizobium TaxID=2631580 RepID=UPI001BAC1A5A|nr:MULTISPECIES: hypothetical protein [unclassified Bradyrhizobium]MBR1203028.1 hypothetical protein [Bradyrhizobium sp. AUGA SZCCT0124]MBR1314443.1 hypothetical protein [Bradyrhizobium sp. AUGA SZCCT0051]MBR1342539.1 hypothetical protein [Bradyrhizobium sp. AUGA SZCCT0105]MBR1352769.1 hypothetical protein [Bradyrhizobium sp. AUGA SZCCT0045]